MLKSYKLDPVDILERSKKWENDIKRLKQEYESITEITAVDTSKVSVQTSNISDSNFDITARREDIRYRIDEIQGNIDDLKRARRKLTKEQNEVLDLFFFSKGERGFLIEKYAGDSYQSVRRVYRIRREALEQLRKVITEMHCGEWVQVR